MKCGCAAGDPDVGKEMRPSASPGRAVAKPRRHRETTPQRHRVTEMIFFTPCFCDSVAICLSVSVAISDSESERKTEHHLRDPHEPGLNVRLAEVGVSDRVRAVQRADIYTVEQVQHLDLQLRRLAAPHPKVLDEHAIHVVL